MGFTELSTGKQTIFVDFSKVITSKCVVVVVVSEIRKSISCLIVCFFLFDLILYVPSTIFQLNRDGSSYM